MLTNLSDIVRSDYWLITIVVASQVHKRQPIALVKVLEKENIETRLLWNLLHTQLVFKGGCPSMEEGSQRGYSRSGYVYHRFF